MTNRTTRRRFLALSGAAAAGSLVAAAPAAAAPTDLSGWFSNTDNADGVVDRTGQSEVTIEVGAEGNKGPYAYAPAAVRVDPGTKVVWKWVNGRHNVVASDGSFESEYYSDSGTFSYTPTEPGVRKYYCTPHKTMGMKGALVVGDAEVALSGGGSSGGSGSNTTPADDETATETASDESTSDGGDGSQRFDGWLANTDNYGGEVVDRTDDDVVRVAVGVEGNGGRRAFDPPAVHVSKGTTVVWEWMTDGLAHDVRAKDGSFESDPSEQVGSSYAVRFDGDGVAKYECVDHSDEGMRGVVVVGNGKQSGLTTNGIAMLVGGLAVLGAALRKGIGLHESTANGPHGEE